MKVVKIGKISQTQEQTDTGIGLFMKNINHYITENYTNRIELSDAAKHVSMSKGILPLF